MFGRLKLVVTVVKKKSILLVCLEDLVGEHFPPYLCFQNNNLNPGYSMMLSKQLDFGNTAELC